MAVVGIHRLLPGLRAVDKRTLEGLDGASAQGRAFAAPKIPHEIHRIGSTVKIGPTGHTLVVVHQSPALITFSIEGHLVKVARLGHGDAAMEKQIAVIAAVQPPIVVQKAHMAAQPLAFRKRGRQVAHHRFLAGGQAVGIGGIDGGQRHRPERVDTAA